MTPPTSPDKLHQPPSDQLQHRLQASLTTLRLAVYATDAMRVLDVLQQHADMSAPFDRTIASACPDWRNPGAVHPPADLLTEVLARIAEDVQDVVHDLAQQDQEAQREPPAA